MTLRLAGDNLKNFGGFGGTDEMFSGLGGKGHAAAAQQGQLSAIYDDLRKKSPEYGEITRNSLAARGLVNRAGMQAESSIHAQGLAAEGQIKAAKIEADAAKAAAASQAKGAMAGSALSALGSIGGALLAPATGGLSLGLSFLGG